MNTRLLRAALLLAVILPGFSNASSTDPRTKQIDAIFRPLVSDRTPGVAVLVIKNGHTIFRKGYGLANLRTQAKITPATNFRLASVTKQFTAMAIMLLARDRKLSYDDPITRFFPDFPAYGRTITVRSLLNHTSGLVDYGELYMQRFKGTPPEKIPQIKDAEVLQLMADQKASQFSPGSRYEYSNSGYAVLAMIVERASGKPFGTFLRERIFQPLRMRNTIAYENGKNEVRRRAYGYNKDGESWTFADQSPTSAVLGDGGVYTSLNDMVKWDRALERHLLLSAQEMQPALVAPELPASTPSKDTPPQYGFGWFLDPYQGRRRMSHGGETMGFRTAIQRFPDERLTVVVLCNRMDLDPNALAQRVADLFAPGQTSP